MPLAIARSAFRKRRRRRRFPIREIPLCPCRIPPRARARPPPKNGTPSRNSRLQPAGGLPDPRRAPARPLPAPRQIPVQPSPFRRPPVGPRESRSGRASPCRTRPARRRPSGLSRRVYLANEELRGKMYKLNRRHRPAALPADCGVHAWRRPMKSRGPKRMAPEPETAGAHRAASPKPGTPPRFRRNRLEGTHSPPPATARCSPAARQTMAAYKLRPAPRAPRPSRIPRRTPRTGMPSPPMRQPQRSPERPVRPGWKCRSRRRSPYLTMSRCT